MATESDFDEEVVTADAATSGDERAVSEKTSRKKQLSVPDLMRRAEARKAKRATPGENFSSPPNSDVPSAKRRSTRNSPPAPPISSELLDVIQRMMDSAVGKVITAFNSKFDAMERRLSILEAENVEKDKEISQLKSKLSSQESKMKDLEEQVESMDNNRRLSCLTFTCRDFEAKHREENLHERLVETLNRRLPNLRLTETDLSIVHRLPSDSKVIAKFVRRCVRDRVFESRFELMRGAAAGGGANGRNFTTGRQMAPLYIGECLTPANNAIFQELLRARRSENGAVISSVFTRRGTAWCKTERGGASIRVPDEKTLRRVLRGARFPPPSKRPTGSTLSGEDRPQQSGARRDFHGPEVRSSSSADPARVTDGERAGTGDVASGRHRDHLPGPSR